MTDNYYAPLPDIDEDEPTAGFRDNDRVVYTGDHRYWPEVILRPDQVDLIAQRVVELLGLELPIPLTPAGEDDK